MSGNAAVKLSIDGRTVTFHSLEDFEFCLDARTEVPARKMTELGRQGAERLHEEAINIRKVERRFTDVLARDLEGRDRISRSMRELDSKLFSQDFRWRSIMAAVTSLPDDLDGWRHAALTRYLGYLRSRQETLRAAYTELRRRDDTPALAAEDEGSTPALRETSIFDVEDIPATVAGPDGFATLPRGETVKVRISPKAMPIMLSRHRFELRMRDELELFDTAGVRHPLRHGRNVVGRDISNDVVVDAGFRDVSRRHLIIETTTPDWLQLTDLSSHGTRVAIPSP